MYKTFKSDKTFIAKSNEKIFENTKHEFKFSIH
jgi:hypothetical protein